MFDDSLSNERIAARNGGALSQLIAEAQAAATGAEGLDETGAVRARMGSDGFPEPLWVAPDWQSRLDPAAFGGAVMQACRAAATSRAERLLRAMSDDDWAYRLERSTREADPEPALPEPGPVQLRRLARAANPRQLDRVVDDLMATLDVVDRLVDAPPLPPPTGTGSDPSGALSVTVAEGGLESCSARKELVDGQRDGFLTQAFARALSAARDDLARQLALPRPDGLPRPEQIQAHLRDLVEETFNIARLIPTPGVE